MSFASYEFLFKFLPLALVVVWIATAIGGARLFVPALAAVSVAFYASSSLAHLALLLTLIASSWLLSRLHAALNGGAIAGAAILAGVLVNLSTLGVWKYGDSLVEAINALTPFEAREPGLLMPLGISFYALQQIGYLLDLHKGRTRVRGLLDYAAFVLFFPQLLAGPIVRHKRMGAEFDRVRAGVPLSERLDMAGQGFFWIAMGLFKKTVIADSLARLTVPDLTAAAGGDITAFEAWRLMLASPLRIYFDFAGYSDMAVGLGLLFGVRLPANFNAPFRVGNFREGWRRWHITFHQFIRDHVYGPLSRRLAGVPLGGLLAMFIAVMLSALWHVDNVQLLVWGLGVFAFILLGMRLKFAPGRGAWRYIGVELVLSGVIAVVFVAPSGEIAARVLLSAVGIGPGAWSWAQFSWAQDGLSLLAVLSVYALAKTEISTQTLIGGERGHPRRTLFGWRPPAFALGPGWAWFAAALFLTGVWFAGESAPFIYFQF